MSVLSVCIAVCVHVFLLYITCAHCLKACPFVWTITPWPAEGACQFVIPFTQWRGCARAPPPLGVVSREQPSQLSLARVSRSKHVPAATVAGARGRAHQRQWQMACGRRRGEIRAPLKFPSGIWKPQNSALTANTPANSMAVETHMDVLTGKGSRPISAKRELLARGPIRAIIAERPALSPGTRAQAFSDLRWATTARTWCQGCVHFEHAGISARSRAQGPSPTCSLLRTTSVQQELVTRTAPGRAPWAEHGPRLLLY